MAELRCVDGALLTVRPVPVLDRDGEAYEVTLALLVDGAPFGNVGERCGWFLASAVERLRESGDALPASTVELGVRAWARDVGTDPDEAWRGLSRRLPRDRELFAFRARDPDDLASSGCLRATLEEERVFEAGSGWRLRPRAVLEAWGDSGRGVRVVLDPPYLCEALDQLLAECASAAADR